MGLWAALLLAVGPVAAQGPMAPYTEGDVAFDYQSYPFGPVSGDFDASGPGFGSPGVDPDTFASAVGGLYVVENDTTSVAGYAAARNPDDTVDLLLWIVRVPGTMIAPGTYPIDPIDQTVVMAFLDDIAGFSPPEDWTPDALLAWFETVDAAHTYLSASGAIVLENVDYGLVSGTFSGIVVEPPLSALSISEGTVLMSGMGVANEDSSWGELKRLYR